MTEIRALTIRQPWAWAIAEGKKTVENRTQRTNYRGPLLIHAGIQIDDMARLPGGLTMPPAQMVLGAIIAVADLTDIHKGSAKWDNGGRTICCPPWGEGMFSYHWMLANVRKLPEPIPCRGQQGLWRPPADVLSKIPDLTNTPGDTKP